MPECNDTPYEVQGESDWKIDDDAILRAAACAPRERIVDRARQLIMGDRNRDHGDPYVNHAHIAEVFNAATGRDLTAREAALFMSCMKLARRAANPDHEDSYVDAVGYAAIEWECHVVERARVRYGVTSEEEV